MIDPKTLTESDRGRSVVVRERLVPLGHRLLLAHGTLTSWNDSFVFVRFKGPGGEACRPEDVDFVGW